MDITPLGTQVPRVKVNYFTVTLKGLNMKILKPAHVVNIADININVDYYPSSWRRIIFGTIDGGREFIFRDG